jgi:hypothetical protein
MLSDLHQIIGCMIWIWIELNLKHDLKIRFNSYLGQEFK